MRDARGMVVVAATAIAGLALVTWGGAASGAEEGPGRVKCQGFPHDPAALVDTRDGTAPLGRWVLDEEDRGWRVDRVDTDVIVKASGAVEAWTTVCVVPVH